MIARNTSTADAASTRRGPRSGPRAGRERAMVGAEAARRIAAGLVADATPQLLRVTASPLPSIDARPLPTTIARDERGSERQNDASDQAFRESMCRELHGWFTALQAQAHSPVHRLEEMVDSLIDRCERAPERFPLLALSLAGAPNSSRVGASALRLATLAIASASRLGWPRQAIAQVGLAGLLADAAQPGGPVAPTPASGSNAAVDEHPLLALALLLPDHALEPRVQLAILQHHEREDGSGFPLAVRRDAISDLARVLAVSDAFLAAIALGQLPYTALEETGRAAARRILWQPAARALAEAVGVFPVGSGVKLSDGRAARVETASLRRPDRPVVRALDQSDRPAGVPIDLAHPDAHNLSIVRAIALNIAA